MHIREGINVLGECHAKRSDPTTQEKCKSSLQEVIDRVKSQNKDRYTMSCFVQKNLVSVEGKRGKFWLFRYRAMCDAKIKIK